MAQMFSVNMNCKYLTKFIKHAFKSPIIAQSLTPGCIFVSHWSILIRLICFFMLLQILLACLDFPYFLFSECCIFFIFILFLFSKTKSCFSEALLLVMSIQRVEGLNFPTGEGGGIKCILSRQWITGNDMILIGFCVRWAAWAFCPKDSEDSNTNSSVYQQACSLQCSPLPA